MDRKRRRWAARSSAACIVSTFATLTILPSIYAILQGRASLTSPSLNPMDPASRYYDATLEHFSARGRFVLAGLRSLSAGRRRPRDLAPVVSKPVSRTVELPGEFLPFLSVSLHAKVPGYVERVLVDRGSVVKARELLVELSAPEMAAQIAEAESKVQAAEADRLQAEAQLAAAQSTYDRMKKAAETPGAIAGNELIQAEKQVEAAQGSAEFAPASQPRRRESAVRCAQGFAGVSEDHRAFRRRRDRSPGASRRAGGPGQRHRRCW